MNLKNNVEIINFIKSSSNFYRESNNEIIIHCPYCDDAVRPNARSHGHLYISTKNPVFHCFRCETSGCLGNLLKDLGFTNLELLSEIGVPKFIKSREKSVIRKCKNVINDDIHDIIRKKNFNFQCGDKHNFQIFESYIYSRIGSFCNINQYLITPEIQNKKLCAAFYNSEGSFVTARILDPNNKTRYIRNRGISDLYYFQSLDFDKFQHIVFTEGVFDSIKLYRFSDKFPKDKTIYISILGKNYGSAVDWVLNNHIPIGQYTINLIFDNDNIYQKKSLFICKKISSRINMNVEVNGYRPSILNDSGEYPFLEKI